MATDMWMTVSEDESNIEINLNMTGIIFFIFSIRWSASFSVKNLIPGIAVKKSLAELLNWPLQDIANRFLQLDNQYGSLESTLRDIRSRISNHQVRWRRPVAYSNQFVIDFLNRNGLRIIIRINDISKQNAIKNCLLLFDLILESTLRQINESF